MPLSNEVVDWLESPRVPELHSQLALFGTSRIMDYRKLTVSQ